MNSKGWVVEAWIERQTEPSKTQYNKSSRNQWRIVILKMYVSLKVRVRNYWWDFRVRQQEKADIQNSRHDTKLTREERHSYPLILVSSTGGHRQSNWQQHGRLNVDLWSSVRLSKANFVMSITTTEPVIIGHQHEEEAPLYVLLQWSLTRTVSHGESLSMGLTVIPLILLSNPFSSYIPYKYQVVD